MQRIVATCGPEQTLGELAELLSLQGISGAPVVDDDGKLLGIVSQTDLSRYLGQVHSDEVRPAQGWWQLVDPGVRNVLESHTVAEILTPQIHSVTPETPLGEIIDVMLDNHVHRLPVLSDGRLVGILSTLDVLRVLRDRRRGRRRQRGTRSSNP